MAGAVAYNPYDPLQQSFLGALAQGESGGFSAPQSVGYGGSDLSGHATDAYGFPQWSGVGNTHAAGTYQFQPGTWGEVASQHNLNFQNPQDQDAGAWYYAQDRYAQATGGSLSDALAAGQYSSVQDALKEEWPSVMGNAASPRGLAGALGDMTGDYSGVNASDIIGANQNAMNEQDASGGLFSTIENWFLRGGLIIVGLIIIGVALFFLVKDQVPMLKRAF